MRVDLWCSSSGEHLSQVYSGFALLAGAGRLDVRLHRRRPYEPGVGGSILRVTAGEHRLVYDVRDHPSMPAADLAWATTYLKRSYDPAVVAACGRAEVVVPLGLNVSTYVRGDWAGRRLVWSLLGLRPGNVREVAVRLARLSGLAGRVLGPEPGRTGGSLPDLEVGPEVDGTGVLLLTRTWDPRQAEGRAATMRSELNAVRVESIRRLRAEYGPDVVAGLAPLPDAVRDHPDLVVDPAEVTRRAFLGRVRRTAVCVTSHGLKDTNGWRLTEYVAASRAIVTEPLRHRVPGSFTPGTTHLTYTTADELLEAVERLRASAELRSDLRHATHRYYRRHVRPDALVERSLEAAGVL